MPKPRQKKQESYRSDEGGGHERQDEELNRGSPESGGYDQENLDDGERYRVGRGHEGSGR